MISDFLSPLREMIHLAGIPNYQKGAGIKLPIERILFNYTRLRGNVFLSSGNKKFNQFLRWTLDVGLVLLLGWFLGLLGLFH